MKTSKSKGSANLTKKATAIFSAAIAALTGVETIASTPMNIDISEGNSIEFKSIKEKPMSVLKLNMNNPENSKFVASHGSHSSHSSHSSHRSHSSHYSGR